jgi:type IV pilus assembly protein PilC
MPSFKYVAKDPSGKTLTGVSEAKDKAQAVEMLRKNDLIIISVEETRRPTKIKTLFGQRKRISLDDIVIFSRQLATMVDAGIPLVGALDILGEQTDNKAFCSVIMEMRHDVETGSSLSESLARRKGIFSALFVNMVKAGEASGTLDEILDRLAVYLEKTSALQRKIKGAMVYPAIVSSMAFLITFILLWKVVPVFKNIFEGFGAALPTPTLILLNLSDGIQRYFPVIIIISAVVVFLFLKYINTKPGRYQFDSFLLNLPIFGVLFRKVAVSKFARTLSTLIKSGVPILAALEIVAKTSGNSRIERAIDDVRSSVTEGENIADPLAKSKVFPPMVTRMVMVGEQAGELEKMLTKIADFYDEQVDSSVNALTSVIEPLIIAFLGVVVGGIVICMFLPMFKLTTIVGGG